MTEESTDFQLIGSLEGHSGWVTGLVTGFSQKENEDPNVLVSCSRDRSLIIWKLYEEADDMGLCGQPYKSLLGHSNFISDLGISQDNLFVISSSWDRTLRLWELRTGESSRIFQDPDGKECLTVCFSANNRQIQSAGMERGVRLWNTLAECKFTSSNGNHTDWVSRMRYSPDMNMHDKGLPLDNYFATVSWDGWLKIWRTSFEIFSSFKAHEGRINGLSLSPNGKYLATGGKDMRVLIWDIFDLRTCSRELDAGGEVNAIAFNPKLQWVAAATEKDVKIWDLMKADAKPMCILTVPVLADAETNKIRRSPACLSLAWNALGRKLFTGWSDGIIRVHKSLGSK